MRNIAIIGAGGHAKVIIDIIQEIGLYNIIGIYDDNKTESIMGIKIIGKISEIDPTIENFIIGIGNDKVRKLIYEKHINLNWATLIHPKSIISKSASISKGTIVCAGAIIQPEVKIGMHCIINTNSNIDHESIIGDFCSICPSTTICGQVTIGTLSFIGANSTIIQCIRIGNNCIVGAGSVIIRNVEDNCKIVGNPGKLI